MIMSYLGKSLVKIQVGNLVVAINPFEKRDSGKAVKFGADIVLVSVHDPNHSSVNSVSYNSKIPFVVDSPGEYEISGTYITGFQTDVILSPKEKSQHNTLGKINTSYCIFLEGMNVCTLGAQEAEEISGGLIEKMGEIDILIIPIGDTECLSAKSAYKLAKQLNSKIIIPISCEKSENNKKVLSEFLKNFGTGNITKEDKLVIKKKDLEDKNNAVAILNEI